MGQAGSKRRKKQWQQSGFSNLETQNFGGLSPARRRLLLQNKPILVNVIKFKDTGLWEALRKFGLVTEEQQKQVAKSPNWYQAEWLLGRIEHGTDADYDKVCEALTETNQGHVAFILQDKKQ